MMLSPFYNDDTQHGGVILMEKGKKIEIFTDGGCHGNPGPGGWACILLDGPRRIELKGYEEYTTNNKMELSAVIAALERVLKDPELQGRAVELSTDSQYVKNGITSWIHSWVKNGWMTSAKKPVKNREYWQQLKELDQKLQVSWKWVRGHDGNELNEACDALVQQAIAEKA
jgi:ribonuclease HI